MLLKSSNKRNKRKRNLYRRIQRCCYLPDYNNEFARGYYYVYKTYVPGVGLKEEDKLRRWTPKRSINYYSNSLRYAGWVVMPHTKYYKRLWRDRNPNRWRAYVC